MAVKKIVEIEVNSNAEKAIGSLRSELRKAQQDVAVLSEKFGVTSKEATEAAKRAAELKDKIGDARALTDAFNPDAKFKALASSLSGVASGFAAVEGGLSLIGVQSESVEKTLLKVQSAMALAQGLQGLGESIDSFKQLGAVISNNTLIQKGYALATAGAAAIQRLFTGAVDTTSTSFKNLRGAIISTGIGALVVVLGYLVSKMMQTSDATKELTDKQKDLNKELEYTKELTAEQAKQIDYFTQIDLENAKKRGASDKELTRIKLDGIEARAKANIEEYNKIVVSQDKEYLRTKEQNKRIQELRNENIDLQRQGNILLAQFEAEQAEKQRQADKERADKLSEAQKKAREEAKKRRDEELQELKDFNQKITDAYIHQFDVDIENKQLQVDAMAALSEQNTKMEEEATAARIALAEKEKQAKVEALDAVASALGNAADLAGRQTGVGKALAIAQATISMFTSAQKAYEATVGIPIVGPTLAPINAGLAIAAGLKNIKEITKIKVPGGGGGGAPSVGGQSQSAPNFNVVGNSGVNQIAQTLSGKSDQAPIKAYVVANDVTTAQNLSGNIISNASLG